MFNLLPYLTISASILPIGQPNYYKLNQPTLTINEDNQSEIDDALLNVNFDNSTGFTYYTFDGGYFDGDLFNLILEVSNDSNTLPHIVGYYILLDYNLPVIDNYYFDYIYKPSPNGSYVSNGSEDMQSYIILPSVEMTDLTFDLSYNGIFTFGLKVGYIVNNGDYASRSEFNTYLSYLEDYFSDYNNLQLNYDNLYDRYNNLINSYQGLTFQQIYNQGYNAGLDDGNSSSGVIMSLFTAVASVPISILNAVMGPTLFGVPIVSILLTFLAVALMLWLIRRFM